MPIQSEQPSAAHPPQYPIIPLPQTSEIPDLEDKVWRLYVRGRIPRQIGKALGQSADWAELTIRRLLDLHEKGYLPMARAHSQKLLDELHDIRRSSWRGWCRSRKDKVRTVEKTKEAGSHSRGGSGNETVVTTEPQCGDASFLRTLIECSKRESALRGIEKPTAIRSDPLQSHADLDTLIRRATGVIDLHLKRQRATNESRETNSVEPQHHSSSQETQD